MPTNLPTQVRRIGGIFLFSALCLVLPAQAMASAPPYSALVMEVESDRVLYAQDPDELRHPASLTKMMTLYLLFEAVSRGQLGLQDTMTASAFAVSKPPSRLGLKPGDTITVEEGILGLVTQSANDAATVIAETLGGSEAMFADMMTQKARQLGMNSTVFRNAQGLPDPDQWTTARDMYKLGKALIKDFPQFYPYFATESFWFRDRSFHNHNHLLGKCEGVDGIKTGFINSSGFNLVASSKRNGVRLVGVVFGGPSHRQRDDHMQEILDDGFAQLEGNEPSVHMASFNIPAPRPLLRSPVELASELAPAPAVRRVRLTYKPVAARELEPAHHEQAHKQAQKVKVVAESSRKKAAPANRQAQHSPAPIKLAMADDVPQGSKNGKNGKATATASRPSVKSAPATHAAPVATKGKTPGKSKAGH